MVDIALAEQLQGWITSDELRWLAEQASKHTKILEIGTYLGRSTTALGVNTKGVVYTIDNFRGPQDMALPPILRDNIFNLYQYNLGNLINSGKVITIVGNHDTIDLDMQFDMIFIDGSHTYEDCSRDILKWVNNLEDGGLLCGHDYTNIPSVRQAVHETISNHEVAKGTSIWYAKI